MAVLVVLKFTEGSWEQGFPVVLQIAAEGATVTTEVLGKLPSNPALVLLYQQWQRAYQSLVSSPRLSAPVVQVTQIPSPIACQQLAQQLQAAFQAWLRAESFRVIRETWLEKLVADQAIRVVLQTADVVIQGLPWHLWDVLARYRQAEIALGRPSFDRIPSIVKTSDKVRILVIIGHSQGIDTATDLDLLRQLPRVELLVLQEPSRSQLSDALWEQAWDILFFAGHSSSHSDRTTGSLAINGQDHLSFSELKYALERSCQSGLELAIFNSCDGLGLAQELAALKIPELIVMRELVPDQVAQKFLQYFLVSFSGGESLYLAVRQARERLQALEVTFPCATWLPVLFQNPAQIPPTWQSLTVGPLTPSPEPAPIKLPRRFPPMIRALGLGFLAGCLMVALRSLGLLQEIELQTLDRMMQLRPAESVDNRILLVTIDETDIKEQPDRGQGSLSDTALSQLLKKLQPYQPKAIGLDLYRDFSIDSKQKQLQQQLQQTTHLIAVCKSSEAELNQVGIAPPAAVELDRVGFSDFISDSDGVLRRQLMFMNPDPNSSCLAPYGFGTRLAIEYLFAQGYEPSFSPEGWLQFGSVKFPSLRRPMGGYQSIDDRGGQILLNYRSGKRPFHQVSLMQVLRGQVAPDLVKNRVILIGTTATSASDYWMTPLGRSAKTQIEGVVVQAHMTSQLISHVLDRRPLLTSWPQVVDMGWIIGWSMLTALLLTCVRQRWVKYPGLTQMAIVLLLGGGLSVSGYALLLRGRWVPVVPTLTALGLTTIMVSPQKFARHES
ncbi:MAG: CHASE2 domain-containing protein [Alkalinema sp. RU_4_3]|nr:CHASE2 domain-containing protein [Alkalinema sp. RU_4_3]